MSTYEVTVEWRSNKKDFKSGKYSRRHLWTFDGGIEIPASSSPSVVPIPYSDEKAVDPEEAFVAAISSCHMLWFLSIVKNNGFVIKEYQDHATGIMEKNEHNRLAITKVDLNPKVTFAGESQPKKEKLYEMHQESHTKCFIANSVKTIVNINF